MALALKAASGQLTRPAVAQVVRRQLLLPSLRRDVSCQASTAKFFVGGNWKANGTKASVEQLVSELNAGSVPDNVDVVVAPPAIYLERVKNTISPVYQVSAQNCWIKGCGAYTGELTADMLKDADIPWVILGHSERRAMCGEGNQVVGDKTAYALKMGLGVIACIGETLDQRNSGDLYKVLDGQLQAIADSIQDWSKVVIAYEPVWAIGTGVVATPAQAQEVHAYVRQWLSKKLGKQVAESTRIIYGGSVNDANCEELAGQEDIDGFLVGGASLKGASFTKICNAQANLSTARAA